MKHGINCRNLFFFWLVFCCTLFSLGIPSVQGSGGKSQRTVKVGYFIGDNFQEKSPLDGCRSGYGYDYLQNVAYFAGWKYEYIDCNWTEALTMLQKGEVDIITDVSKTAEREKVMRFADMAMGTEEYYLYILDANSPIRSGDYAALAGKRVGITANTYQLFLFRQWAVEHDVKCIVTEYFDEEDRNKDFLAGKLDAAVDIELYINEGWIPVHKTGSSNLYIAVAPGKDEILKELNAAQSELYLSSPFIIENLKNQYYRHEVDLKELSANETAWLKEHTAKNGRIRLGYLDGYLPYCAKNSRTGQLKGALSVIVANAKKIFDIDIECIPYNDLNTLYTAAQKGEINACFPLYKHFWQTEQLGILQTEAVMELPQVFVYRGSYRDPKTMKNFAVAKTDQMQLPYLRDKHSGVKIELYDDYDQAFEAVQSGKADGLFINSFALSRLSDALSQKSDLGLSHLPDRAEICLGVDPASPALMSIFNKLQTMADKAVMASALIQNSPATDDFSLRRFYNAYSIEIISCVVILGALIIGLLRRQLDRSRKARAKAEEARQNIESLNFELEASLDREKKTQTALQEALEAANLASDAKTNFLANMSHDIRTPMNAIIGMTAIAGTHLDDRERVADCLAKITSSSKHLLGLINDILDMSKIEAGKLELALEEIHLPELIENLITISRPLVESKRHEFNISLGKVEHEYVIGDSQRIQQVFLNLVSNAVKYTPEGGEISLKISEKPSNSPRLGLYEFVIADNGIGMDKDFLPHIFETFTRADDRRTGKVAGTGLGMAITKSILTMMNGDIKVESELGKGSTFTVTLCLKLRDQQDPVDYSALADLHVLVVDDDAMTGETACAILSEIGMKGEFVSSGREAIERVKEHHEAGREYFAVIIDWKMPDMDGVATAREIRRIVGEEAFIVISSAHDWIDIEADARAAGANAFIAKPLFKSRVARSFRELINGEEETAQADIPRLMTAESYKGKRALLVEDNELNVEIAQEILSMTGLTVEVANDGKQAFDMVAAAADNYYDIVFMDIQMPVMNGYDATRAIRNLPKEYPKRLPIIAMTANAFAQDVLDAKTAGMNEHIAKPIDLDQLNRVLKKWLE